MSDNKNDPMPILTHQALGFDAPKKKLDPEDEEYLPRAEPEPPVIADPFLEEIAKIKRDQSPAVRDTIDRASCFGRHWYVEPVMTSEQDEGGICTEIDCDLRFLCELIYSRATGKQIEQQKDEDPVSFMDTQDIPDQSKKKLKKKRTRTYTRFPYVDQGRPIDKLATQLWKLLGGPPSLPESWSYPTVKTKQDRAAAPQQFRDRFGPGIMVSRRLNYHSFFRNGSHFLRFWMTVPGGGWLDVSKEFVKVAMKTASTLNLENPPPGHGHRYAFYPQRIYVFRQSHMNRLAKVFANLGIVPLAEQQEKDHED